MNHTFVGKKTTLKILGIPVSYKNYEVHKYRLQKNPSTSKLKSTRSEECVDLSKNNEDCFFIRTNLFQNFVQQDITMSYFDLEDLMSKLGGIGATLQIAIGSVGAFFMIQFALLLNGVIRRKQKEKLRLFSIEKMMKQMSRVTRQINA